MQPIALLSRLPNTTTSIILEKLDINKLWQNCGLQDRRAQEQIYNYFSKRMFATCMRYAHTTLEAEDILQNGFVKIFTKHNLYDGSGSLEGWMKRIMVNTAIETYRKNQGKFTDPFDESTSGHMISTLSADQTGYKDLMALVQELPTGYRTIFNLYAIEGYSHKEIAELLAISEGNSKSQLSRAREWLQARLGNKN